MSPNVPKRPQMSLYCYLKSQSFGNRWCFFQPSYERNPRISSMLELEQILMSKSRNYCSICFNTNLTNCWSIMCFKARRLGNFNNQYQLQIIIGDASQFKRRTPFLLYFLQQSSRLYRAAQ